MWRQCGFKGLCHKDRNMCNFAVRPFAIGTAGNFVWGNTVICKDASVKSLEADLCMYQAWPSYAMFLDGHTFWNIQKKFFSNWSISFGQLEEIELVVVFRNKFFYVEVSQNICLFGEFTKDSVYWFNQE